ncbi:MAG: D-aminoacyl-tRNA deacylase [Halanaerobiaceae bacterium]
MRAVVQRIKKGSVRVEKQVIGKIESGLLVFLGIGKGDDMEDVKYLVDKIVELRIFSDKSGAMNLSAQDLQKSILIVPQFTLYGDCRQGRRPSFSDAARPKEAERLYDLFVSELEKTGLQIETGKFQAKMEVELVNDGPVTMLLESDKLF